MSLTSTQRQAALDFIATVSDGMLASLTWQAVGHKIAAAPPLAREVAALHCRNVIDHSHVTLAGDLNATVRQSAQSNIVAYSLSAERLLDIAKQDELPIESICEFTGAK